MDFRWTEWNVEHLARHGVDPEAAEDVVLGARRRYPRRIGEDKWLVWGADGSGRLLQVFVLGEDGSVYVVHARPPTEEEKRRHRRETR